MNNSTAKYAALRKQHSQNTVFKFFGFTDGWHFYVLKNVAYKKYASKNSHIFAKSPDGSMLSKVII